MNMDVLSMLSSKAAPRQAAKGEKNGKAGKSAFAAEKDHAPGKVKKSAEQNKVDPQANEAKLSKKAQDFLKNLREKYGDYDFFVGGAGDDLKALSGSGSKEFSVIFSGDEIERMANDEKYAAERMSSVEGAVQMSKRICEENGFASAFDSADGAKGVINKISIAIDDNGSMKIYAEVQKYSEQQRERIERARETRAEAKKAAEKKAQEKKAEEKKAHDKADKQNPYEKGEKDFARRTVIEASSEEELIEKLRGLDWNRIAPAYSGDKFSLSI